MHFWHASRFFSPSGFGTVRGCSTGWIFQHAQARSSALKRDPTCSSALQRPSALQPAPARSSGLKRGPACSGTLQRASARLSAPERAPGRSSTRSTLLEAPEHFQNALERHGTFQRAPPAAAAQQIANSVFCAGGIGKAAPQNCDTTSICNASIFLRRVEKHIFLQWVCPKIRCR